MPTVMPSQSRFAQIPKATIERSVFDRSHGHKTTFDAGLLVPVYVDEALPGDTFHLKMSAFARLATPLKPVMDNMYLESFFFAVPLRLVWANFQKFMGEQINPGDSTNFVIPKLTLHTTVPHAVGTLEDYFGWPILPVGAAGYTPSCLYHRSYALVYNEWFRDENLVTRAFFDTGDGPLVQPSGGTPLRRRGKRHDYFTSSLPWPQKGTAVSLPLGSSAPLNKATTPAGFGVPVMENLAAAANYGPVALTGTGAQAPMAINTALAGGSTTPMAVGALAWKGGQSGLIADLSAATASTINELRQAFQIQKLLERDARGGTRYTEKIKAHFGVTSPDARLQRPEYLGGGSTPVNVSPISQTAPQQAAGVTTPQGNLAAIGTVNAVGHGFAKSFTEHCIILGLVCVRADLTYQQGIEKQFTRSTLYDFYWPALSHIGEQAVLRQEIYCTNVQADNVLVFGYQERYAEYRYKPSRITGQFRSTLTTPLDMWHLSQEFTAAPTLSQAFIEEDPPIDRVIAVQTEPHFLFDSYFALKCARPMPVFGVPGLIDHF